MTKPVFRKIDCYSVRVGNLDEGIAFYGKLGHALLWRDGNHSAGLSLPDSDGELVLHTDDRPFETCLLVDSVETAIESIVAEGGRLAFGPIGIQVGKYALLKDPWDNPLPILDFSNGLLLTDSDGNVIGNQEKQAPSGHDTAGMEMKLEFHHVCIETACYAESLRFYTAAMGFEIIEDAVNFHGRAHNTWIRNGNSIIELQTPKAEGGVETRTGTVGLVHVCFRVDDLDECLGHIDNAGFAGYIDGKRIYRVNGIRLSKFAAPEGTIIELREQEENSE